MVAHSLASAIAVVGILICVGSPSRAEENFLSAVIRELPQATVSLDQALRATKREGTPVSAEYDVQDGDLQSSVYAKNGDQFSEVIVDPKSGSILKTKPLTDPTEINEAQEQSAALSKAKLPLEPAIAAVSAKNTGYRAISVIPMIGDDRTCSDHYPDQGI